LHNSILAFHTATSINEGYQASRIGFNRMISNLRMIPSTINITDGQDNSITYTNFDGESITYTLSGGVLQQGVDGTYYTCMRHIDDLTISYLDTAGATISPPITSSNNVWRIEVEITVSMQVGGSQNSTVFRGSVTPRNFLF